MGTRSIERLVVPNLRRFIFKKGFSDNTRIFPLRVTLYVTVRAI